MSHDAIYIVYRKKLIEYLVLIGYFNFNINSLYALQLIGLIIFENHL